MGKDGDGHRVQQTEKARHPVRILVIILAAAVVAAAAFALIWWTDLQSLLNPAQEVLSEDPVTEAELTGSGDPEEGEDAALQSPEEGTEGEPEGEPEEETEEDVPEEFGADSSEPGDETLTAEGPEVSEISIIMVGDVLMHEPLQTSGRQADGTYNYDHFFTYTKDLISAADIAIVNQEDILGGRSLGLSSYPIFNAAYELGDALVNAGFDVICHATNHAVDKGETGLNNCLNFWRTNYPEIHVLGIHDSQEDRDSLCLIEQDGITIAILNYTYGTNGISLPHSYSVDLLQENQVREDLARAREEADFVIVVPHWGTEYSHKPSSQQERWTQVFLECGVDLVIGAHPHVIQPVELLEREDGHQMLVYYSLGNYINYTSSLGENAKDRAVGAMATVTLAVEDGSVSISEYGVIPLVCHMVTGTGAPTVYPLSAYTEELMEQNSMHQHAPGFTLEYCDQLCREVFGDLYQPDGDTDGASDQNDWVGSTVTEQ